MNLMEIDIILLSILLILTLLTCGYCAYRVFRLQQEGQVAILLKPTKVLFSHKREGVTNDQLRTVVAYQNPFTGDYYVHKSREGPRGYMNSVDALDSPDSGVSDAYEPLNLDPPPVHGAEHRDVSSAAILQVENSDQAVPPPASSSALTSEDNSVNKTWNWNYTEYQI